MFREVSDSAVLVDRSLVFIIGTAVAFLVVVTTLMLWFVVRYRASRHPVAEDPDREGSTALEIAWTVGATILVVLMFWFGWRDFTYLRTPPADALRVRVTAQEWSWRFTYANGRESDVLTVPLGRPTRLDMTSLDVIHSAYIPAFRIKEDVVPGMTTHLWFTPLQVGKYDLFCTEYCGEGHSHMQAVVDVVPEPRFAAWLAEGAAAGPPQGEAVLREKGCLGCHAIDGPGPGAPGFRGLYGSTATVVTGGVERAIAADEAYLRRSILDPAEDVVKGYPNIMPKIPLDAADLDAVVAALKALGGSKP